TAAALALIHMSNSHFTVAPAKAGTTVEFVLIFRRSGQAKREPGPLRRVLRFERCRPTAFPQRLRPVVMGPRVRGDDETGTHPHSRDAARARVMLQFRPKEEGVGNAGWQAHPQPRVGK